MEPRTVISRRRVAAIVLGCGVCLACGGPEFTVGGAVPGEAGPGGGGNDAASETGFGSSGDAAPSKDAATPACPNVAGSYAVVLVDATGCGDLSITAPQCIQQDPLGCAVTFVSQGSSNTAAINGDATLQGRSFTGAQLKEGTVDRSGCSGIWDATTATLTVDCGGTGSVQSCIASLRRTGARCS
jgi:hypothetical protein